MTQFVLILGMFINASANAGMMTESDIAKANAGERGVKVYYGGSCPAPCHQIKGHDVRRESVQQVRRGNWEPATQVTSCADEDACISLLATLCPDSSYTALWGDVDEDGNTEAWCTRRGFVGRLLPDAALATSADAAAAAKAQEKTDRATKGTQRETQMKQCARAGSLDATQMRNCLQGLIKEVYRLKMDVNDL